MPDFFSPLNLSNMLVKQDNVYGGYGSTQIKPNWSTFVGPQDQNTHLNLPKLGTVNPVDLSSPQKKKNPNSLVNGLVNNSVNFLTTGLQYLSNMSGNSYEAAQNRFNQNQLSQQNLNKDLYSTKQDYFGRSYYQDGGMYADVSLEDLEAMKSVGGFEDFSSYIDEGINYHKSLAEQAKYNVMKQELEEKYKKIISNLPTASPWQDNYQYTQYQYNDPYANENTSFSSPSLTGLIDNRSLSQRLTTPNSTGQYITNFFKNKGLPSHVAAGITGNLEVESVNFDPNVILGKRKGDYGFATGLAQWHPDRWKNIAKAAQQKGLNPYSLEGQLEGMWNELNTSEKGALNQTLQAKTPEEAANIFNRKYERSADFSSKRAINAKKYVKKTGGVVNKYENGGVFADTSLEDLQAMKDVGGFEDFSDYIDQGINYYKSLAAQAKYNLIKQEMEEKYKQALSSIPQQQWQDDYQFSQPQYKDPYANENTPYSSSTGLIDNRGLGARISQPNLPATSGPLMEFFYNNPENKKVYRYKNGIDNSYKGPMSGHWNHAHLAANPATIQQILPILPKFGLTHTEGFGKTIHPVHAKDSHHYHNEAIDINSADGKDEARRMDNFIQYLKQNKIIKRTGGMADRTEDGFIPKPDGTVEYNPDPKIGYPGIIINANIGKNKDRGDNYRSVIIQDPRMVKNAQDSYPFYTFSGGTNEKLPQSFGTYLTRNKKEKINEEHIDGTDSITNNYIKDNASLWGRYQARQNPLFVNYNLMKDSYKVNKREGETMDQFKKRYDQQTLGTYYHGHKASDEMPLSKMCTSHGCMTSLDDTDSIPKYLYEDNNLRNNLSKNNQILSYNTDYKGYLKLMKSYYKSNPKMFLKNKF
jgi:hypothetical protein